MDTKLKILLAQDEVFRANKPYLEWPSLFSNNMVPLQKNIDSATAYINSLSDAEIYQRQSILHWEDKAINRCNGLIDESYALLRSSIDVKRLAKLEIENINLLLEEGVDRLITRREYSRFNRELPVLYRDLVNGRWSNFIFFEELKCSRQFHLEWQVNWLKTLKWSEQVTNEAKLKILNEYQLDWEWVPISVRVNRMRELPIKLEERISSFNPRNINIKFERNEFGLSPLEAFFNITWHQALDIQGLIWYRNYLQEVEKNGKDFSEENNYFVHDEGLVIGNDADGIRELERQDYVYKIMVSGFKIFNSLYDMKPNIDELMIFINEQPLEDIKVSIKFSGRKAMKLVLDDDKLYNRAALIRRFNRYFG